MTRLSFRLETLPETAAQIARMHPGYKRQTRAAIRQILANPFLGKALVDDLEGLRSYRVGRLRIVYRVQATGLSRSSMPDYEEPFTRTLAGYSWSCWRATAESNN